MTVTRLFVFFWAFLTFAVFAALVTHADTHVQWRAVADVCVISQAGEEVCFETEPAISFDDEKDCNASLGASQIILSYEALALSAFYQITRANVRDRCEAFGEDL